jgi:hypothetical protein
MGAPDFLQLLEKSIAKKGARFAVGEPGGRSSSVWRARPDGNDLYIAPRGITTKISLHETGICRLALDRGHFDFAVEQGLMLSEEDRALMKWRRPPAPDLGVSLAVVLVFPTSFLGLHDPTSTAQKPLFLFEPAAQGRAVEIGFFYSREPAITLEPKFLEFGKPTFRFDLDNGETVWMVAWPADFDPTVLPSTKKINAGASRLLDPDAFAGIGVKRQNLNGLFWAPPADGEAMRIIEIGGITMKRNR